MNITAFTALRPIFAEQNPMFAEHTLDYPVSVHI